MRNFISLLLLTVVEVAALTCSILKYVEVCSLLSCESLSNHQNHERCTSFTLMSLYARTPLPAPTLVTFLLKGFYWARHTKSWATTINICPIRALRGKSVIQIVRCYLNKLQIAYALMLNRSVDAALSCKLKRMRTQSDIEGRYVFYLVRLAIALLLLWLSC